MSRRGKDALALSILAALVVLVLAMTTGCSSSAASTGTEPAPDPVPATVFEQPLPGGGSVECIFAEKYRKGGLSCDWANATHS